MSTVHQRGLSRLFVGSRIRQEALCGLLALSVPLIVYLYTMAPTVWWLDSAELTTGAYTLGIVHAPGAPLFLLLGHLFTYLPFGDVGYRLNFMTACTSALTALFIYLISNHLTRRPLVALGTAWFAAFGFYVWMAAAAAELYSLQGCIVTGLLFLGLKWREQQRPWQLCALAFLFGLGTGNHLSLVLMLPGFMLLALTTPLPWRRPRWLAASVVCGFLGGLIWLYLPLRYEANPVMNYARIWGVPLDTWSGFWWMVTGKMFEPLFFGVPLSAMPGRILGYLFELWSNFFGIGVLFGVWGLYKDAPRRPLLHASLATMFIGHLVFYLPYSAPDQDTMLLPTFLIWALWCGLGVYHLEQRLARGPLESMSTMLLLALAVSVLAFNFPRADIHSNDSARVRGEQIFHAMKPNAMFFGTWIDAPILEYLQIVDGRRPDVKLVNLLFSTPAKDAARTKKALSEGRPVYTAFHNYLSDFGFSYRRIKNCNCLRIVYTQRSPK